MTDEERAAYQKEHARIVCAATKLSDGHVLIGARHYDDWMREQFNSHQAAKSLQGEDGEISLVSGAVQGFIDQYHNFYTRREAWIIAARQGQIRHRCGGDGEELYSENLY